MDAAQREPRASLVGPAIVLAGAAGFVVACFLPFYEFGGLPPQGATISFYRLNVNPSSNASFASQVGGFIALFAGVAIIASIAILLLRKRPRTRTLPALVAAVAVWSLWWFGTLPRLTATSAPHGVGYWGVLLAVGVVTVGTLVSVLASRPRAAARDELHD